MAAPWRATGAPSRTWTALAGNSQCSDNAFFYAFASFAESVAPLRIHRLVAGKLIDVTVDSGVPRARNDSRHDPLSGRGRPGGVAWETEMA